MKFGFVMILVMNILFVNRSSGQIIAWEFNGNAGSETSVTSTTTNANLNISTIGKGSGLANPGGGNAFTGSFGAVGYTTGTTSLSTAISSNEYLEFTISAKPNFKVSLSTLDANFLRSTGNAPTTFQWQYSLDGFSTAGISIGSAITYTGSTSGSGTGGFTATNGTAQAQINLSSISALQNVLSGTIITIRIYGWGAGNAGSTFALGRLSGNDLAIGGSVVTALVAPVITANPSGQAFCQGLSAASFTAAASGDPAPSVKWQKNTVDIPGATSTTYTISAPTSADNGSYRAVFTNSQGSATTSAATLTVYPSPVSSVNTQTNITCYGANDGTIIVSASGGTSPYTFSVDNGTNYLPATGSDLRLFTGLLPNTPYPIKVKDNNGCISK